MKMQSCALLLGALSVLSLPAYADVPSLTGAIYRGDPSGSGSSAKVSAATAIESAQAYVRRYPAGDDWEGPKSTDAYGRFTFGALPDGVYQLRIYRGSVRLWDQVVTVPAVLQQIVVRDIVVAYYVKPQDKGKIAGLLGRLSFPYEFRKPEYSTATNTLWFGDSVRVDDVKTLAASLITAGVSIRAIRRFKDGSGPKANLIEIGASKQHVNDPPITVTDVRDAVDWPKAK